MRTYDVQEATSLALAYKDPAEWFIGDRIFVKQPVDKMKGKYRVDDPKAWYQNLSFDIGKEGYALEADMGDSFVEWDCEGRARGVSIMYDDLKDYASRGFTSADQMKQARWEFIIHLAHINKEVAAISAITTDANYDAANRHAIGAGDFAAALPWSNSASKPIDHIDFLKRENKYANTMVIPWITYHDLMMHPQILDAGSVTASDRDNMSPSVSIRYLEAIFKLSIVVSKADVITAATADLPIASQVLGPIWGDYIWVGNVNMQSNGPRMALPTWGKQYIYTPVVDNQGWMTTETIDPRAGGGVGKLILDLGFYNQYKTYATPYGQRLNGIQ